MFPIYLNTKDLTPPTDNIYYLIGKKKKFLYKNLGLMESLVDVDEISILEDNIKPYIKMKIPKISKIEFSKIVTFFSDIYQKYGTEVGAVIFYNEKSKKFLIEIPFQSVSYGGMEYTNIKNTKDYTKIGTIHSHGNMSAFHSGIDKDDEKWFDGIHITIGSLKNYIKDNTCDLICSLVSNNNRFEVDITDYVDGIIKEDDNQKKLEEIKKIDDRINTFNAMYDDIYGEFYYSKRSGAYIFNENNETPSLYPGHINSYNYSKKLFIVEPYSEYNQKWFDRVTVKTYTINNHNCNNLNIIQNIPPRTIQITHPSTYVPIIEKSNKVSNIHDNVENKNENKNSLKYVDPCDICPFAGFKLIEDTELDTYDDNDLSEYEAYLESHMNSKEFQDITVEEIKKENHIETP